LWLRPTPWLAFHSPRIHEDHLADLPTARSAALKILNGFHGADTGGVGYQLQEAFRALRPDWEYQTFAANQNWIQYPTEVLSTREAQGSWQRAWDAADVVHVNNHASRLAQLINRFPMKGKPLVVESHGTELREDPEYHLGRLDRYKAVGAVSTLDLYLIDPEWLNWLPVCYDLDWLGGFRKPPGGALRIGHAPTNRNVKGTMAFLDACEKLSDQIELEVVLIEKKPWLECLALKGTCDIYYDQVELGYGCNAVECWGMGIPVVAGAQPATLAEMRRRFGAELPFVEATEDTIYEALRLLVDPVMWYVMATRGRTHVERFHSRRAVVPIATELYEAALEGRPVRLSAGGERGASAQPPLLEQPAPPESVRVGRLAELAD